MMYNLYHADIQPIRIFSRSCLCAIQTLFLERHSFFAILGNSVESNGLLRIAGTSLFFIYLIIVYYDYYE
jgi:hypothetical protein